MPSGRNPREEDIAALFSRSVAVSIARPGLFDEPPPPEEAAAVAGAVEKRRREFAAGRACARAALRQLGCVTGAIPVGPSRAPVWPSGFVGSITHCEGFCCAVAAAAGTVASLGLDAEDAVELEPAVARYVLRPDEADALFRRPALPGAGWAKLAFSAKEAVFKCLDPQIGVRLDFRDVAIRFLADGVYEARVETSALPAGIVAPALDGRWRVLDGRVYTGATLPAA